MRRLALISLVTACAPDAREAVNENLPDGIYEPAPGEEIWEARLVADGDVIWWAYTRALMPVDQIWLSSTDPAGRPRVAPTVVDPDGVGWQPDVAVDGDRVVVAMRSGWDTPAFLRAFDKQGAALTPLLGIPIAAGATPAIAAVKLVPGASGLHLIAGLASSAAELVVVGLDTRYSAASSTPIGSADGGGTSDSTRTFGLAGVQRSDGTLVVGWDRNWDQCFGPRPSVTLTTSVDGSAVAAIQAVRDMPERSEALPAIAASGDSIYLSWQTDLYYSRSTIALARYPDVSNVVLELGDPAEYNIEPALALEGPGIGAVAWQGREAGTLNIVGFEDGGSDVLVGAPHVVELVNEGASATVSGLVALGSQRYVLGWVESFGNSHRLYARALDLAGEARARPAPSAPAAPTPSRILARPLPCTH